MVITESARRAPRAEWWLLGASIIVGGLMIVVPIAIPAGVGLMVSAIVLLVWRRPRKVLLAVAIAVLAAALVVVVFPSLIALIASSTSPEVTLIKR
jgi:hypothetical protein